VAGAAIVTFALSDLCVIAAVNDDEILKECLALSPDIADGTLPLTAIRGALTMAEAYNAGLAQNTARICLFAHQDVYFPAGFAARALAAFDRLEQSHPDWMVAGPYGVTKNGAHVGRVWDVNMGRELGGTGFAPTPIESLDELLLIVKRDPGFAFDPDLPHFHLYGTDLVQSAWAQGRQALAIELPVVHNNRPYASLGPGYVAGYNFVRRKWRQRLPITTTICRISYNPLPLWRVQWRRRKVAVRPEKLLAHAPDVARKAGYE
jgi:hypothetical protein